ncbi:MAG: hypothetical protein JWQ71_391 [Pedosphaera sp.]|nr:hypothetical protein [Pedosphaera sp.]
MHQSISQHLFEDEALQAVALPYTDHAFSMIVLLPRKADGLSKLEAMLNSKKFSTWLEKAKFREAELFLPRFKLESSFEMTPVLKNLGMTDGFTRNADFSGIDGTKLLYISDVLHKAFLNVDEEGTEASGIFALRGLAQSRHDREETAIFRADHPFLFLIRDNISGSILFMGRVVDPAQ